MAILSDYHVHTAFSTDSDAPMEKMVEKAISLNHKSICFTDHIDYGFPKELGSFLFDIPSYLEEIARLKKIYGRQIFIYQGVEMGIKPDVCENCKSLTDNFPFDFVIGSTHLVENKDPYYPDFWEGISEEKGMQKYYEATLENIRCDLDFDVYGHIDYIIRYTPSVMALRREEKMIPPQLYDAMKTFGDIIDTILKELIARGKGLECNTAGFHYGLSHPNPHESILKRYLELGGEILTIGSDAHDPTRLGYAFEKIPALLKQVGFRYYTTFQSRKPIFHPL